MLTKADQFTESLASLAEQAKALSHPARLSILQILAARDTCICGDLVEELPLAQASVSRHLKALKEAGLIKGEVDGPRSCYCLNREALVQLHEHLDRFFQEVLLDLDVTEHDCC
jgi:ArsR family transcriptional regulator